MEIRPGDGCRSEWGKPFANSRTPRDLFLCAVKENWHTSSVNEGWSGQATGGVGEERVGRGSRRGGGVRPKVLQVPKGRERQTKQNKWEDVSRQSYHLGLMVRDKRETWHTSTKETELDTELKIGWEVRGISHFCRKLGNDVAIKINGDSSAVECILARRGCGKVKHLELNRKQ